MEIYDPGRFPYYKIKGLATEKRKRGNPKNRKRRTYVHNIAAFDIETTRIEEIEQSVMYVWQFAIEDVGVCIGRTWPEFITFLKRCAGVHHVFEALRGVHARAVVQSVRA